MRHLTPQVDLGFGTMRLRRTMLPWAAHVLRAHRDSCPRASEVRHLIFSVPKGTARRAAFRALHAVFEDWRNTYAPGMPWVSAIQKHNGIYHLHAAVANVNSSGRPLKFLPHMVVAMADMKFTDKAISAKGTGKKGLKLYTKARGKLGVEGLAERLVAADGSIRNDEWRRLKKDGAISDFRTRKDGSIVSFIFDGKRIRLSTLNSFVERLRFDSNGNSDSSLPLPSGLSSKDVEAINTTLRQVSVPQPRMPAKSKTRTRNHPKK
jgi:hypothetical protein